MAKKDTSILKWKRKKWTQMLSPAPFGEQNIGETLVLEPTDIVDKTITLNLMHVTRNMKKQNFNITFKAIDVDGHTKCYALTMQPASIKRLVRSGRDRIDESFIFKSNDDVYGRVKPLFITYSHQSAATRTRVRRAAVSFIRKYAAEKSFDEFVKEVVDGKIQKELHQHIKKFLKLRTCEIRAIEMIENFSALKEKQMKKREEREAKKLEQEEALNEKLDAEAAQRKAVRAEEIAAKKAAEPAPQELEAAEEKAAMKAEKESEPAEEVVAEKAEDTEAEAPAEESVKEEPVDDDAPKVTEEKSEEAETKKKEE